MRSTSSSTVEFCRTGSATSMSSLASMVMMPRGASGSSAMRWTRSRRTFCSMARAMFIMIALKWSRSRSLYESEASMNRSVTSRSSSLRRSLDGSFAKSTKFLSLDALWDIALPVVIQWPG